MMTEALVHTCMYINNWECQLNVVNVVLIWNLFADEERDSGELAAAAVMIQILIAYHIVSRKFLRYLSLPFIKIMPEALIYTHACILIIESWRQTFSECLLDMKSLRGRKMRFKGISSSCSDDTNIDRITYCIAKILKVLIPTLHQNDDRGPCVYTCTYINNWEWTTCSVNVVLIWNLFADEEWDSRE